MKKFITTSLIIIAFILSANLSSSQTAGSLNCSFTTVSSGGYTPKNCLAAWIETSSGTFIKTKFKYSSNSNLDHLATWTSKSGQNVVDAITGSTRSSNGLLTLIWNGTDVTSAIVADGTYKVWIEFAWASSLTTGKVVQSFSFTKGATADHQTGTATANLTGITLDWVPNTVGVNETQNQKTFTIYPNPVNNQSSINYTLNEFSDVTISLYDISGKLVKVLLDENQKAGTYNMAINNFMKLKLGIYIVKMNTGKEQYSQRILVLE